MLKKKERRNGKTNYILEDGLYIQKVGGVFKITNGFRFEEQPKEVVISGRRLFRVIDGIAVPLAGVGGVEVEKSPRMKVAYIGEIF